MLKVADGLTDEINAFSDAGRELNFNYESVSDENVNTLKASVKFVAEHQAIMKLIKLYKQLIEKDKNDLFEFMKNADALDENIKENWKTN